MKPEPITIDNYAYLVLKQPIQEHYPQLVAEQLVNLRGVPSGNWMLWQVDNIHDIDQQTQCVIVATDNPHYAWSGRIASVPTLEQYYAEH